MVRPPGDLDRSAKMNTLQIVFRVLRNVVTTSITSAWLVLNTGCTHFVDISPTDLAAELGRGQSGARKTVDVVYSVNKSYRFEATKVDRSHIEGIDIKNQHVAIPINLIDSLTVERLDLGGTIWKSVITVPLVALVVWAILATSEDEDGI
ncbi:MAG: hypothetical protein VCA73_08735 [Roseibacillus sp.]